MPRPPPWKRPSWSWAGVTVLILAICLGGGWATALVFSASSRTPPINDTTKDLLSSVGGVLAGAITAYIGGIIGRKRRDEEDDKEEPEDKETS